MRSTTIVTRLTEHDDVIKSLLRGAPRLDLALGPAFARAGPDPVGRFVTDSARTATFSAEYLFIRLYFAKI